MRSVLDTHTHTPFFTFIKMLLINHIKNTFIHLLPLFFVLISAKSLTCYCNICPEEAIDNEKCETRPGGSCFASVRGIYNSTTNEYDVEYEYGCMPPEQSGGLLQVNIQRFLFGN